MDSDLVDASRRLISVLLEVRNPATVAGLITERARRRTESRGLHASVDYPETDNTHWQRDTIITAPTSE